MTRLGNTQPEGSGVTFSFVIFGKQETGKLAVNPDGSPERMFTLQGSLEIDSPGTDPSGRQPLQLAFPVSELVFADFDIGDVLVFRHVNTMDAIPPPI